MGIIQRQSIKHSIVSFIGVVIALLSTLYIYKLDEEIYGFALWVYSTAFFLTPFASVGIASSAVKNYPQFSNSKTQYFNTLLLLMVTANLIFCLLFFVCKESFYSLLYNIGIDENGMFRQYVWIILPLCVVLCINFLLINHAANLLRIVVPEIFNNLGYKIALPLIVFAGYKGFFDQAEIGKSMLLYFVFVAIFLFLYLARLGAINFSSGFIKQTSQHVKTEFIKYSTFSGLNTIGTSLAFRIDIIMISTMIGWEAAGIYGIMLFLANVIEIPQRAIGRIAAPIISKAWTEGDWDGLHFIYKRSSINLFLLGGLIFSSIWFGLPLLDVISVGEDRFVLYKYVFLFLGLGKLFGMLTSVNGQIIIYSSHYKYNLLFLILLGILNVALNMVLISKYQIMGAALATCLSYFLFNLIKFLFLWFTYKMTPFSSQTIKLLAISSFLFFLVHVLPLNDVSLIGSLTKVVLFGMLYIPLVLIAKISTEANGMINTLIAKLQASRSSS